MAQPEPTPKATGSVREGAQHPAQGASSGHLAVTDRMRMEGHSPFSEARYPILTGGVGGRCSVRPCSGSDVVCNILEQQPRKGG